MREEDSRHQFIQLISFKVVARPSFEVVYCLDLDVSWVEFLTNTLIEWVLIDPLALELDAVVDRDSSFGNRLSHLDVHWREWSSFRLHAFLALFQFSRRFYTWSKIEVVCFPTESSQWWFQLSLRTFLHQWVERCWWRALVWLFLVDRPLELVPLVVRHSVVSTCTNRVSVVSRWWIVVP